MAHARRGDTPHPGKRQQRSINSRGASNCACERACNVRFALCESAGRDASRLAPILGLMGTTDDELDATSRRLLNEIDELKRLEVEKRHTARSSDEFHDLAAKVDNAARHVFDSAAAELIEARDDSPLTDERDEQHPGDWTEGPHN